MNMAKKASRAANSRWRWLIRVLFRRIWFRAALFSLSAVLLALLSAVIAPFIPYDMSAKIGADAVDNILGILASSMLAVTTFSLTAMVSAVSGASSTITPRATQILVADSTAQNALSTFLGAFLFAIVGICALSTGLYGASGRVILFAGTLLVIAIIVVTLLRWIEHLSTFGRVASTIERIEHVTLSAIERSACRVALHSGDPSEPDAGWTICFDGIGYVAHIDVAALEAISRRRDCPIDVLVLPGTFVTPTRPILRTHHAAKESEAEIRAAFTVDRQRNYDHDPRLGLVVLAEIASRALSPAVNDPGTAIAVLTTSTRVMARFLESAGDRQADNGVGVTLPAIHVHDLLEDIYRPIARDGAGCVEVALRLQKTLGDLAALAPFARGALVLAGTEALARTQHAMALEIDREHVRAAYRAWATLPSPDEGAR